MHKSVTEVPSVSALKSISKLYYMVRLLCGTQQKCQHSASRGKLNMPKKLKRTVLKCL